jgi:hypothetical protein
MIRYSAVIQEIYVLKIKLKIDSVADFSYIFTAFLGNFENFRKLLWNDM